ncbi:protoporphyrinogen oxidase [Actinopolymorpha rutila]|uniref:Coproporphyrinogen III oxidase n=1 Tax=Actinopolymorpha rutila TaxID=446787 RepID=A0A852ZFI9_9ACTN|nr:protoporphyrinogen oxidase [Actinopolymorpha rutila]NYH90648.1 oxygen-dependent protoporphyrinogen oxidase [Actinopolymorpha rutila]
MREIVIVGGGIAGAAAAWFLHQAGRTDLTVTILEGSPRIGGKLATAELAGIPVDTGAEAMLNRRPEAVDLARAVGLGDALRHPATTSASVWTRGGLRPLPAGTVMGIPADESAVADGGILGPDSIARIGAEPDEPGPPLSGDVAIGKYVERRLGREIVDLLLEPLLGGVYAGHADELSLEATVPQLAAQLRSDPSLVRAAARAKAAAPTSDAPVFAGLDGGVGRLVPAVAEASGAVVRTDTTVRALARNATGWELLTGPTRAPATVRADAVVLACPARPASRLLETVAPGAAADLAEIEYASMATIALAYPVQQDSAVPADLAGSGFLVPPVERRSIKAATYSSRKWGWLAERAPGLLIVRASIGRHREEADLQRSDEELVAAARDDLAAATGIAGEPVDTLVQRWGGALPQYAVGHRARVERIRAGVAAQPGLAVAGAAYDGLGIPACVASARSAATQVLAALPAAGTMTI